MKPIDYYLSKMLVITLLFFVINTLPCIAQTTPQKKMLTRADVEKAIKEMEEKTGKPLSDDLKKMMFESVDKTIVLLGFKLSFSLSVFSMNSHPYKQCFQK